MNKLEFTAKKNLPEKKSLFDKIITIVKKYIIYKYRENEDNLRFSFDNEEISQKEINNYFNALKLFDDFIINKIHKEERLKFINNNQKENNELYNSLLNNYFMIFLMNNLNKKKNKKLKNERDNILKIDKIGNIIKLLNLTVNIRMKIINYYLNNEEKEIDIINLLTKTINWVESYSEEIILIIRVYIKLDLIVPELFEKIQSKISKKEIKYKILDKNNKQIPINNEVFFIIINSFLNIINSNDEIYKLSENIVNNLLNIFKEILKDIIILENNLNLYSDEVITLKEIIKIVELFYDNDIINKANISRIINYFRTEKECNNGPKKISDNFNSFYNFLFEKLIKEDININNKFYKVLSFVLLNEYNKNNDSDFREFIIKIIIENNDLIKNSSIIIKSILDNVFNHNPKEMIKNLEKIKEEKSIIFKKLNNINKPYLDEVIMNIFEAKILNYFETIKDLNENNLKELFPKYFEDIKNENKNEIGIILDNSKEIFIQTIHFLDEISINISDKNVQGERNKNLYLCKLYSIVYVKIYLYKTIFYIKNEINVIEDCKDIFRSIKELQNCNLTKIINIYIFKLLYYFLDNNFEQLKNFNFNKYGIELENYFSNVYVEKDEIKLSFFFLPLEQDDFKKYKELSKKFEIIKNQKFKYNQENINLKINNDIDIFLTLSINRIIFDLTLKVYISDENKYKEEFLNFSSFIKTLFEQSNNPELKKLIYLFCDYNTYAEKMTLRLPNKSSLEILLYGFRICVQSLESNNNEQSLYKSFLKKECLETINQSLIPGIDILEDLHLVTLDTIITHLNTKNDRHGCYVCSCGYYYDIDPCGFPTKNRTFDCPVCGLKIGWGPKKVKVGEATHGMVIRPGHYRIFKDEKQKKGQMRVFDEVDENIPNILLENYLKEVIEPIKKNFSCGFNSISKNFFKNKNKKIRNLSQMGYRLLNFISYCFLFFSYCIDYISKEDLKKYLIQNMTILEIIEADWILLKEELEQKNISIHIFMNMIFKELSKLIKECKYLKNEEERNEFEDKVEKLIEKSINNYSDYSNIYIEENKKQIKIDDYYNIETIVTEQVLPNEEIYPEKEYPFFKYFILTNYKTREDFIKHMDKKENYPLINQLLLEQPDYKKMKYLPIFKEFINYMIEKYSFKISRDEAKRRVIKNEEIYNNDEFKNKFNDFIKIWNQIKSDAIKYKCNPEMPVKDIDSNDKLINFLNDDGEIYNGMYLASACQNFIDWQNTFLQPIIDPYNVDGILHKYIYNIKKKILLQDSKPGQILLIEERFKKSKYKNLNDIINIYSERNIFGKNGTINYYNYNNFIYDYDTIEEELGKIIISGIHLFENDKLFFINYLSEGFIGERSQIFNIFISKYPQKDFENYEEELVINYIKNINNKYRETNNNKYNFQYFFGSIQMIIFYLSYKVIIIEDEKIINILKQTPLDSKISEDCKYFFYNEGKDLTINKMMNLYCFFEHLCFEELVQNLQEEYKKGISNDIKNNIINKLIKNNKENIVFNGIKDLGASLRRFISRYLVGKLQSIDIKGDRDLSFELYRDDLWNEKNKKNENLIKIIIENIKEFKLTVDQGYAFYELICDEDKKSLEMLIN